LFPERFDFNRVLNGSSLIPCDDTRVADLHGLGEEVADVGVDVRGDGG